MRTYLYCLLILIVIGSGVNHKLYGTGGVKLPAVTKMKLKNGLAVYYIKDELPQLSIVVSVGYGSIYETKKTAGLSDLVAKTLSIAGSKKFPGMKLHDTIAAVGGKLSIGAGWENTIISVKVLARFAPLAFKIIKDLVANPNFNGKSLKTAQGMLVQKTRRKYDDPAAIAFEKAREIIFNGNGYGAVVTEKKIMAYTLDDVNKTWNKYFTAGNIHLGIVSSVELKDITIDNAGVRTFFADWKTGKKEVYASDYQDIKAAIRKNKNTIFLYPKDVPQATIVVGTVGPDVRYKDNYSLSIMNYILGGGSFNSRLMKEIRVKRGLAYSVGSVIRARKKTGVFLAYAQVKNEKVDEALPLITSNCMAMTKKKISETDIQWAKKAVRNSYIFNFDTPMSIIGNYIDIAYNNLPADYYDTYLKHINEVNAESILRSGEKLFSQGLITVVVGRESIKKHLSKMGKVRILK